MSGVVILEWISGEANLCANALRREGQHVWQVSTVTQMRSIWMDSVSPAYALSPLAISRYYSRIIRDFRDCFPGVPILYFTPAFFINGRRSIMIRGVSDVQIWLDEEGLYEQLMSTVTERSTRPATEPDGAKAYAAVP